MIKKIILLVSLVGFAILTNCEKEDICTETVLTPRVIIKFYNHNAPNKVKSAVKLKVWVEGKDTIYKKATRDSILLPLNTFANYTKYIMSVNDSIDTLTIKYEKNNVFVSRACGYKTLFTTQNDSIENTTFWMNNVETINPIQQIENESKTHIKIYH